MRLRSANVTMPRPGDGPPAVDHLGSAQNDGPSRKQQSTDRTMQRSFAEVIDWRVGTRMTHDPRTSRKAAEGAWE